MALSDTLNFYKYITLETYSYETINGTVYFSVRVTVTYDRSIVGKVSPFNVCNVEFEVTSDIDAWECRATFAGADYGVGKGLLIANGTTVSVQCAEQFGISNTQLTLGEGEYRISVYVKKNNIWYGG